MTYIKLGGVRAFSDVQPTKEQAAGCVSPSFCPCCGARVVEGE